MKDENCKCKSYVNTTRNEISFLSSAILLVVLFAVPIVSFVLAGMFSLDIAGYGIKDQSEPIMPIVGIPEDVLGSLDMSPNDVAVVTPSMYDSAMQSISGIIPWAMFVIIILTPLSELIQYFVLKRKGTELELVSGSSLLLVVVYFLVAISGGLLTYNCAYCVTLSMGLELSVVTANIGIISHYIFVIGLACLVALILWAIPVISYLVSKVSYKKDNDLLDEDEEEFINDSKISEE